MTSPSKFPRLTGLIAATHTPFHADGTLNLKPIEKQAEHLLGSGATGAFIAGTTGEFSSLTIDERKQLMHRWKEVVQGTNLKWIVHIGDNCQAQSSELARTAQELKADGIASVAPYYFKPHDASALIDYFRAVTEKTEIPFYYYDIPHLTGVHLPIRQIVELGAETMPTFAGIKYSNMDLIQLQEAIQFRLGEYDVLFGFDECLVAAMMLGVTGAVGCTYNFASSLYLQIIHAFVDGNSHRARQLQYESVQLVRLMNSFGFMAATKSVMSLLDIDCGPVRSPLPNLSPENRRKLFKELESSGLIQWIRR